MSYDTWITGIYDAYDGMFKYHEHEDQIRWLENIIIKNIGKDYLWDKDGEYNWKPRDEYEGFKRCNLTTERRK
jgi:hypothetical protein